MFEIVFVLAIATVRCQNDPLLVKTTEGSLRGTMMKTINGRDIYAFKGIPFAEPPIGDLRFRPPVPVQHWKGTRDASKAHEDCPQRNNYVRSEDIVGDEDCLYLNVYTPQPPNASNKPLPVMIFFHGGGWLCGGGNTFWYGPEHLLDRDVVLVSPNYRLGALGFLSTGDSTVPGNNGLKDQTLALKWVRENIAVFGGDPNAVTLFGESAGGASAHYHMLSPLSRGLFAGAISQSGTALGSWTLAPKKQAAKHARKLASLVKCPIGSSREMVECLRTVEAFKFVQNDRKFMSWDVDPMIPFKPVVEPKLEGAFMVEDPIEVMKGGKGAQVPWIVGINSEDGALRSAGIYGHPHLVEELDEEFQRVVPVSLLYDQTAENVDSVTRKIREFYFGNGPIDNSTVAEVTNMYTDAWFLQGADDAIRMHKKHQKSPVYYYLFGYRGACSFSSRFGDPHNDYGVCHVDELQYLFPIYCQEQLAEVDKPAVELLTTIWSNFAKTGNPTPETTKLLPNKWEPVQTDDMEYYYIKTKDTTEMKTGLFLERAKFWRTLPTDPRRKPFVRDEL